MQTIRFLIIAYGEMPRKKYRAPGWHPKLHGSCQGTARAT